MSEHVCDICSSRRTCCQKYVNEECIKAEKTRDWYKRHLKENEE